MNLLGRGNPEDIPNDNYTIIVNGMTVHVKNPGSLIIGKAAEIEALPASQIPPGSCKTFQIVFDKTPYILARGITLQPGCEVPLEPLMLAKSWVSLVKKPDVGDNLYAGIMFGSLPLYTQSINAYGSLNKSTLWISGRKSPGVQMGVMANGRSIGYVAGDPKDENQNAIFQLIPSSSDPAV